MKYDRKINNQNPNLLQSIEDKALRNNFFANCKLITNNKSQFTSNPKSKSSSRVKKQYINVETSLKNFLEEPEKSYNNVENMGIYNKPYTINKKASRSQRRSGNSNNIISLKDTGESSRKKSVDGKRLLNDSSSNKHILKDLVHKVSTNIYCD